MTLKEVFKSWKVILLVAFLLLSLLTIKPQLFGTDGVMIQSVAANSSAANGGMQTPPSSLPPLAKERIISVDGQGVNSVDEYYAAVTALQPGEPVTIETSNGMIYSLLARDDVDLGIRVKEAPTSNLRKGLDLAGGTRVLLAPETQISEEDLELVIGNLQQRLNVCGLGDVIVQAAADLAGNSFILVEMAGVTEEEVKQLLASQGKFEAKIGNETVFYGGDKDVTYVCRSAECSGLDASRGCVTGEDGHSSYCSFFFAITLSPEAAERQSEATKNLDVLPDGYLSEDITLFLDDVQVDSLRIGQDLQGRPVTNIQISGSGSGPNQEAAIDDTLQSMKRLQTILITGSLPVKLDIVKLDTVSPTLGQEFLNNIWFVGLLVIIVVSVVVFLRYRKVKVKVIVPMVLTLLSELVLILGFAALVGWNLDLAGIAGILIVVGTGVDHLIVITDETLRGEHISNWKTKIKNAMFIVMGAYFTTFAGMLPLLWAGAGLLKGFALTTIAGISFGVLIARPAYAVIIEKLLKD